MKTATDAIEVRAYMSEPENEQRPIWEEDIRNYVPDPISIDEVGWNAFLGEWSSTAFELTKELVLMEGLEPTANESRVQSYEKQLGFKLPREVFFGGVPYPGATKCEKQFAQDVFARIEQVVAQAHQRSNIRDYIDEVIANHGLFSPSATQKQVADSEKRLGLTFPPSYKEFLLMSNGWLLKDEYLLSVDQIDWYSKSKWSEWFADWEELLPETLTDNDSVKYGVQQHPVEHKREGYIWESLLISDAISDVRGLLFLNRIVVFEDGEWEAWFGIGEERVRYRSFKSMLEQMYRRDIGYLRYNIAMGKRRTGFEQ